MNSVYLSLGSNQGDRINYLQKSIEAIDNQIGKVVEISSYFETEPWGFITNTFFINQVICVKTLIEPLQLLEKIFAIESHLGRLRYRNNQMYTNRCIDIDILLYDEKIIELNNLTIPHKFLHERRFVLEPLNQIASNIIHPLFNISIHDLLLKCVDKTMVKKYVRESLIVQDI
jgi:2-amino-4-hydroxy-6-hydroxymethyldihydropteridine diphosphokinase